MKVVLTHAYSASNSGDGLLVTESENLIREAFPEAEIALVALDPSSFGSDGFSEIVQPISGSLSSRQDFAFFRDAAFSLFRGKRPAFWESLLSSADLVVAVGGGYLRAGSPVEAIKTLLVHHLQLPTSNESVPFVYLSQSVGPFRGGTKALFISRLRNITKIVVRDDRSAHDLSELSNVVRLPDLALLGLPEEWKPENKVSPTGSGPIGLIARQLNSSSARQRLYNNRISELYKAPMEAFAQATGRGNNDLDYYKNTLGVENCRLVRDSVVNGAASRPEVMVSVRLHGALESIRSGVPSVHLSYERKGWGAFGDLGIGSYVHNAFNFDPKLVLRQVEELRTNPEAYWRAVEDSIDSLNGRRNELISVLSSTVGSAR